jgi:hypothetical protein
MIPWWLVVPAVAAVAVWYTRRGSSPAGPSYDAVPPPSPAVYLRAFAGVLRAFYEAEGASYSWGGGHPPKPENWPHGSIRAPAEDPGFDCTGLILNMLLVLGLVLPDMGAGSMLAHAKALGQLRDPSTARPGDVMFFANRAGKVIHAGMVLIPKGGFPSLEPSIRADMRARAKEGIIISAFHGGSKTHADDPRAKVMWHTQGGTGLAPAGVWSWATQTKGSP